MSHKIAIIGVGNMGGSLAKAVASKGAGSGVASIQDVQGRGRYRVQLCWAALHRRRRCVR